MFDILLPSTIVGVSFFIDMKYKIRVMTRKELDIAIEWAALEGWNPGINDADCFFATDPKGFFIGLLDSKPIACFSAVVSQANPGGISLAKMHGMKKVFETARMYSKDQPSLPMSKIFGITSFELG